MNSTVIFQVQSCLILALMLYGAKISNQRNKHIRVMSAAMIWDILLILQIELSRSAVATAAKLTENTDALLVHLFFAVSSVVLYVCMIVTGRKFLAGNNKIRATHKKLGYTTLLFRVLTLVTSFWASAK